MDITKEMKKQVKKYIDDADDSTIKMLHAMLEAKQEFDWWDELPEKTKKEIDQSLKELDSGKGIPHSKVKQMHPQWFTK